MSKNLQLRGEDSFETIVVWCGVRRELLGDESLIKLENVGSC